DGMLTQQQAKRAALLDSPTGGQYVGLLLDETEYEFTTGLVGVVLKSGPASVLLGRIVPAGNGVFHLSATGPDENMARLHQSDIASMHQCVLVTNRAVC
ncbi:MAG: hypothetical protein JWP57_2160, partial [Spirosoma sp.]|nr:hypothetical protein [Spirosoma sp.]